MVHATVNAIKNIWTHKDIFVSNNALVIYICILIPNYRLNQQWRRIHGSRKLIVTSQTCELNPVPDLFERMSRHDDELGFRVDYLVGRTIHSEYRLRTMLSQYGRYCCFKFSICRSCNTNGFNMKAGSPLYLRSSRSSHLDRCLCVLCSFSVI